jgi:hypothetical protein
LPYAKPSKRGRIANQDHVHGAIIVEVVDANIFHFRQVQADKQGRFVDLGLMYGPNNTVTTVATEALVLGDWHSGSTDPLVRKGTKKMIKQLKPNNVVYHDFFDGISVNHHIEHKLLTKAMMGFQNDLKAELSFCAKDLADMANYTSSVNKKAKTVVVKSNHDHFLDKWLDEFKFKEDQLNRIVGLELALAKAKGLDPLEQGLLKYHPLKNVTFLKSEESLKIAGVEVGQHGHLGVNGAKGSAASLEKSYTSLVIGHSHSPQILRGCWTVGTSSLLKLGYNVGPSSWAQTHCIIYANGQKQLVNFINGKWRA